MIEANEPLQEIEDTRKEDIETLQNKIAEQLAELSSLEEGPVGFRAVADPFESGEIDFSSNGWLLRVLQVQAWLYPDAETQPPVAGEDASQCANKLFAALGVEKPSKCVETVNGVTSLTLEGAGYLATRLDSAVRLQQRFSESLETLNRKQATSVWREAWDEENENDAPAPEPIKARSETWRISDFSGKASKGLLNLNPSYQRGDVWPTSDAQKLIESILRGIPLPSIILLKPATDNKHAKYEVVDGKQRLTSILRFIGQHPEAIQRVKAMDARHPDAKLADHFRSDYKKFRRVWKSVVGEPLTDKREAEYYFPFRLAESSRALRGPLGPLAGKYYCEIVRESIQIGDGHEPVEDVFERSSDYKIPLIEYLDATPKQIHEVFHLYNRQGKHLNAEEIRNALFHDVDLVRLVLVASGDNPSPSALAPYIPSDEHDALTRIARCLNDYHFGRARYKRTKLLSWLFALLFQPSEINGELSVRSTAKQIDSLFGSIRAAVAEGRVHRLADHGHLVSLIRETDRCLDAHSSADCWDARFKDDDKGQKWQELQLVASLVAVFLIGMIEASPSDVLERFNRELRAFTHAHPRPEKTQNKTQWSYIGEVALGILEVVGADGNVLEAALFEKYGVSCLATLRAARASYKPRSVE